MERQGSLIVSGTTLGLLALVVVLPLSFVFLQAIFPHLGSGSFAEPFAPFATLLAVPELPRLVGNTLLLGLGVGVGCLLVALPLAAARGLFRLRWAPLWDLLFLVPFMIPPYIGAFAWVLILQRGGFLYRLTGLSAGPALFSYWGIVWVMTLHLFPVVYFALSRTFATLGTQYLNVARVAGASPLRAFARVTLPLAVPGLAAGLLLVFALTIEEFGTPATLGARSHYWVLVTAIHRRYADWPVDLPGAALLSCILVVLAMLAFGIHQWLVKRRSYVTVAGKHSQAEPLEMGRWEFPVLAGFALVVGVAMLLPVMGVLAAAFTRTLSGGIAMSNWSLVHFTAVVGNETGAMDALRNSILLGGITALVAGVLGAAVAFVTVRTRLPGRRLVDALSLLPNTLPGMVVAVGLILAWNQPWWPVTPYNTPAILVLAYVCLLLPYPVRYTAAGLQQIGTSLEDAARVSGAGISTTMRRIVLPLVVPHLLVSMLLVFAVASRELVASIMLAPPGVQTVSTFVFNQFEQGQPGQGMALSVLAIFTTTAILVLLRTLYGKVDAHG